MVRPTAVLVATLRFLEANVLDRDALDRGNNAAATEHNAFTIWKYAEDRMRQMRQEFTLQNYRKGGRIDR